MNGFKKATKLSRFFFVKIKHAQNFMPMNLNILNSMQECTLARIISKVLMIQDRPV